LTPLERRVVSDDDDETAPGALPWQRVDDLLFVAYEAAHLWPPLSDPAAEEARLRGMAVAARAVLTLHTHSGTTTTVQREEEEGQQRTATHERLRSPGLAPFVMALIDSVLGEDAASGGVRHKLRAMPNALTSEEEATLRDEVLPPLLQQARACQYAAAAAWQTHLQRAADDVARHGLRACALPGCGATEPQPKAFKVCSRCRRACYCSAAHQQQDWRRHKRADACAKAPQ
jgi:hypothetical protein